MDAIFAYNDDDEEEEYDCGDDCGDGGSRNIKCMVCNEKIKQYKCPGCGILSCSLICCKLHKVKLGCTGKRDRVGYISMQQYKEKNLINDYHFLEDVLQTKERGRRLVISSDVKKKNHLNKRKKQLESREIISSSSSSSKTTLPRYLQMLVDAGRNRETTILLMPEGMSKRKLNTTKFMSNVNMIIWKVEFVFILNHEYDVTQLLRISGDDLKKGNLIGCSVSGVKETSNIKNILTSNFFDIKSISSNSSNLSIRHTLRSLRLNHEQLRCYIQHIPSSASSPLFHEICLDFSIKDALKGKTVIECPKFFIGLVETTVKLNTKISTLESLSNSDSDVIIMEDDSNNGNDIENNIDDDVTNFHDMKQLQDLVSEIGKRSFDDLIQIPEKNSHYSIESNKRITQSPF